MVALNLKIINFSLLMFRILSLFILLVVTSNLQCQVGVGNVLPQAAIDITSTTSGVLIPRVALTSAGDITTVVSPNASALIASTLVYNTGTAGLTEAGFYFWNGGNWAKLIDNSPSVFVGKATITGTGHLVITTLPFKPKRITFTAYANIEAYKLDAVGSGANNKDNAFGFMKGYANDNGATIEQQVINGGGSGESINNISRYASPLHCIGMRYANQNAVKLGLTTAMVTSFNANGFTLNVDSYLASENLVVIFEAYRY
jgi:hypothetical protein